MTRQHPPLLSEDGLRQGGFWNETVTETMPRLMVGADNAIGATGVAHATAVPLQAGDVINNITFITGGTAASGPTAGFIALYSSAATPALLAQSAGFTTTARAANTAYKIPLASTVTITASGLYWVSISFAVSTTVPTLRGASVGNAVVAGSPFTGMARVAQTHGSSLTGTAPATLASGTAVATPVYYILTTN